MRLVLIVALIALFHFVQAIKIPSVHDMELMESRRIANIMGSKKTVDASVHRLISRLKADGSWSDIDYTSGCEARAANWPATDSLSRTRTIAIAYAIHRNDTSILQGATRSLDYWFNNDFESNDCMQDGGKPDKGCPCGTPGLWNKNWFNQVISVPRSIGNICLLLKNELDERQRSSCTKFLFRAFDRLVHGTGFEMTGANLLDLSSIGITLGLLNDDSNTLHNALDLFYGGVFINPVVAGDGIQSDGSFMQHKGLLYNGNYGKDYISQLLSVFIETKETDLAPPTESQLAFETLMSGTEWMIMADAKLNQLLWQYSVIGRMISTKYSDKQASSGVAIDLKKINQGTQGWDVEDEMDEITDRLSQPHTPDANQGDLVGTRYFYNSDYLIHRAPNYISTMKMYSSRTINSECVNKQNTLGFHLSDGAIFNYLSGDEYVDAFGAWNWDLVPGITVDYKGTPLQCSGTKATGLKSFVGGVTNGNIGAAVMDYQNPSNQNLSFQKTVFFFPSGYAIQIAGVTSKNANAPLVTVLDQRKRNGNIYVDGKLRNTNGTYTTTNSTQTIWHDKIGYYFPNKETLHVDSKPKAANWEAIGISRGNETQHLWTSYIKHPVTTSNGLLTEYVVLPNMAQADFQKTVSKKQLPIVTAHQAVGPQVNAAYSAEDSTISVAFWTAGAYKTPWKDVSITTDKPCLVLLRQIGKQSYRVVVSDPSQTADTIKVTVKIGWKHRAATYKFPKGSSAGKGISKKISFYGLFFLKK